MIFCLSLQSPNFKIMKRTLIEVYKGKGIYRTEEVVTVNDLDEHWSHDFIIGLDDSKMTGNRKEIPMTYQEKIETAHRYIDWRAR